LLIKKAEIISLKATGEGAIIAGVLSYPNEVDPSSITISSPISIGSSVTLPTNITGSNVTLPTNITNSVTLPTNIAQQSSLLMTNPNFDNYSAQINSNGWTTLPTYLEIQFTVPANSIAIIEDIFFQTNNSYGMQLIDDTASSNNQLVGLNPALNMANSLTANAISQANDYISLGTYGQLTAFGVATGKAINNQSITISGIMHYNRIINTGSTSFTGYIKLSQTNKSYMTLSIKCLYNATITFNISTDGSGTSGSSGGGGGGCWTADTLFVNAYGQFKPFSEFHEGDYIMTGSGPAKIIRIIYSGKHEVFKLDDNVWITYPQPFKLPGNNEIKQLTINDFNNLKSRYTDTWDCEVEGNNKWLITASGIKLLDRKID